MDSLRTFVLSLSLLLLLLGQQARAQRPVFRIEGIVHGYEYYQGKGLLKRVKPAILEGVLEDAKLQVYLDEQLIETSLTNSQGFFQFELQFNQLYELKISRPGYNQLSLWIDTRAMPRNIQRGGYAFTSVEFVLNSYKNGQDPSLNRKLGRLYYHPAQREFKIDIIDGKNDSSPYTSSSTDAVIELLRRSLAKNNELLVRYKPLARPKVYTMTNSTKVPYTSVHSFSAPDSAAILADSIPASVSMKDSLTLTARLNIPVFSLEPSSYDEDYVKERSETLLQAKEQLNYARLLARTERDSLEIVRWEKEIADAEREIKHARLMIGLQADKLSAQENSLYLLIAMVLMMAVFLAFIYTHYRQKQRTSAILENKNQQITDSINYARRIQQSILIQESALQKLLPESFVMLKPKDIVSGDFYFFAQVEGKHIIAVADCTGHGVPGAFMSLIGHRLLREIVLEKKISSPALILEQLHRGILEALHQEDSEEHTQDGMDISVVAIDPAAYSLTYAGAMNPAYLVKDQELFVLKADIRSVGGKTLRHGFRTQERNFTNQALSYVPGSMLYMFTDGYMDQFGGSDDKKLNTRRFKELLMDIQPIGAYEQKEEVVRLFQDWKGETPQTDDVLLLGIRLL